MMIVKVRLNIDAIRSPFLFERIKSALASQNNFFLASLTWSTKDLYSKVD